MIEMGNFHEWEWLRIWVENSKQYTYRGNWDAANMFGFLEEGLGYVYNVKKGNSEPESLQLDLLFPIKEIEEEAEMDTLTIKPIGELVSGVDEIELFDMPELMLIGKEIRGGGVLGDHTPGGFMGKVHSRRNIGRFKKLTPRRFKGVDGLVRQLYAGRQDLQLYCRRTCAARYAGSGGDDLPRAAGDAGCKGRLWQRVSYARASQKMGYDNNYGLCGWNIELNFEDDPDPLPKPIDQWSVLSPVKKVR